MRDKIKVLMTGAGAPGGPGIFKALQQEPSLKVYVADINPKASGILLSEDSFLINRADDEDFIDHILKLCIDNQIDVLFPLVTRELFKLANNKERFKEHGISVLTSDYEAMCILNDKGALLSHLKKCNIDHPDFKLVNSASELEHACLQMGYPNSTVVIKPSVGNGSRGIRVLDPSIDGYDLLFNHKPNSLHSTLDRVLDDIGTRQIPEIVVSEYLPGEELTIDTVIEDGELKELLIRTRDEMRSGISVSGRFVESQEVSDYVRSIIDSFPKGALSGAIGFQVKKSQSGKYLLLESNPRIQGTSVAALGCNVNLPVLAVYSVLGREYDYKVKPKVGFTRYYSEVFYEY